ncbi:MAG: serine/threonine-protein kinase, partial [Verrucomicrobiota bacterium]
MESNRFGNFDLEVDGRGGFKLLGKGTFGSTYLARHRFLDTLAAIKVINEQFATEPFAHERFLSEARAVAKLDHKHIARVQDVGESGGALFYAMEYCGGGTLAERVVKHGACAVNELHLIAKQVAAALACCHEAGFIHRDLKPSNLMLAQEDAPLMVKLIDFGLVYSDRKVRTEG